MPVHKSDVISLLDMKKRFDSMKDTIDKIDKSPRFPMPKRPDEDTFPDLPDKGTPLLDAEIESLLLQYQAWIEYYEGKMEREEAYYELLKSKMETLEGVLFADFKAREVGSSTELQRTKLVKASDPYVSVLETYVEVAHVVRKLERVLRVLNERSKKLSRIIEHRKRRGGPDG